MLPPLLLEKMDYWHGTGDICMQQADTVHIATVAVPARPYIIPIAAQTNTYPPSSAGDLRSCICVCSPGACQTKEKLRPFRESCREVLTA